MTLLILNILIGGTYGIYISYLGHTIDKKEFWIFFLFQIAFLLL